MTKEMQHFEEKIYFGTANLVAAAFSLIGGILTDAEAQWVYVTLTTGIIVSTALALMTRRDESMRIVAGRSLFAIFATVVGTRVVAHYCPDIAPVKEDVLLLSAVAGAVCIITFTAGYGLIRSIDQQKLGIGAWLKNILIVLLSPKK